eukprot:Phypoly_transcript_21334.p1 GENE.Phypoly_transcript_21334~~Phypoly_transcript_21334.p1  ORF type:complete len:187 (+),score=23.79 Phypoly_transcript_21334:2-562(+)
MGEEGIGGWFSEMKRGEAYVDFQMSPEEVKEKIRRRPYVTIGGLSITLSYAEDIQRDTSRVAFVSNLGKPLSEREVCDVLETATKIKPKSAYVFQDAETRVPATFAKVEYHTSDDAQDAISFSGTFKVAGKVVQIQEHKTAEQRERAGANRAPGRYSGARQRVQYCETGRVGATASYALRIEDGRR